MKVAITASSGQLGGTIVKATAQKLGKDNVIAVARTPKNAENLGLEVRKGDYNNKADLAKAFEGVEIVLLVSSNNIPEKRLQEHANVIDSAKEAGVKRLVYVSILGEDEDNTFNAVIKSNRDTEDYLKNSGIAWTIGRNSLYIEPDLEYVEHYIKEGKIVNCAGDGKCTYTSRGELGEAYACLIADESHSGKTYNLAGEPITQKELADIISEVYEANISYETISVEEYEKTCVENLGEFLGKIISGIYHGVSQGAFDVSSDFEKITGRKHITMLDFFKENKK